MGRRRMWVVAAIWHWSLSVSEGIDTRQLDKLQKAINSLTGPLLTKFKGQATYSVALALQKPLQHYPGPSHSPVIWASEKQRRWYFAMRRKAGLPLEYTRRSDRMSQRLHAQWSIRRSETEAVLGNRATYAPYVQSSQYQTAQHAATGWVTDKQAADEAISSGQVKRIVDAQINAIVREAFKGL